jgi:hypothetical protein
MSHTMLKLLDNEPSEGLSLESRMRALTDEFAAQAARDGVKILAHREIAWERFRLLSIEKQTSIVNTFLNYYRTCAEAVNAGLNLKNGAQLLQRFISNEGFRICESLYDEINDQDIIEVYSKDFTQIFRNIEMLRLCSYSIVDLSVFEWPELFRRPHVITQHLIDVLDKILTSESPETVYCGEIPEHLLEEIFSSNHHKLFMRHRLFSPLFTLDGETIGFVAILRAHLFDPNSAEGVLIQNVIPLSNPR